MRSSKLPFRFFLLSLVLAATLAKVWAQTQLEGHDQQVNDFAWSPGGKLAASIDVKGQVILWNLDEGTSSKLPSDPLNLEQSSNRHLQFSADGKRLFVGCSRKVRIWDVESKKSLQVIGDGSDADALMVSHDGNIVILVGAAKTTTWIAYNTSDGNELIQIPIEHFSNSWQLTRNGSLFAWPNYNKGVTELFDLRAPQLAGTLRGFKPWTSAAGMAIADNDQLLIACDSEKNQIIFWNIQDPKTPKLAFQAKMPYVVQGLHTTSDGKTLAIFESKKIHLVDVATRKAKGLVNAELWGFAFSGDGSRLLAHLKDDQYLIADAATGRTIASVSSGQMHNPIHLSPKGDRLAVARGSRIEIRDLAPGKGGDAWKEIAVLSLNSREKKAVGDSHGYSSRLLFSPKGEWLCYSNQSATRLIPLAAPQNAALVETKSFTGEPRIITANSYYFGEDDKKLLLGSVSTDVIGSTPGARADESGFRNIHMLLDLETKKLGAPRIAPMTFQKIWSSSDGSRVAALMTVFSGDLKASVTETLAFSLINPANSQEIKRLLEKKKPDFACFSPDLKRLAAIVDGEINIWNTDSYELVPLLADGKHQELAFSPDSKFLYSYQKDKGEVVAYSLDQGQEAARASVSNGHSREPYDVAFAHKSPILVSVGENGEVVLRHLPDGEIRGRLQGHTSNLIAVEFSADDKVLATVDSTGEIRLWQVGELPKAATMKSDTVSAKPDSDAARLRKKIEPALISTIKTKLKYPGSVGDRYRGLWLRFSSNNQHLCATEIRYGTHCFNVASGQVERSQTSDPYDAFASADDKWFYHFHHSSQGSYPSILRRSLLGRDVTPETLYKPAQEEISTWCLTPDGKSLLLATRYSKDASSVAVVRIDLSTGKVAATLSGEGMHGHLLQFSPGGKTLAALLTVGKESQVALLDPQTLSIQKTLAEATMPGWGNSYKERYGLLFSSDGTQLALASEGENKSTMRILDLPSGKLLAKLERKGVTRPLAFLSRDELLAIVDGRLATVDLATTLIKKDFDWFEEFGRRALSRDGALLAEGLETGEVVLRDLRAEGSEITKFKAHETFVGALAFSDDGKLLATMNNEDQIKVWNLSGERLEKNAAQKIPNQPRRTAKVITDLSEFTSLIASPITINFDDLKTTADGQAVEFKSDRYAAKGLLIEGEGGQFVSQKFAYPDNFIPVSKPNMFAPGPKAAKDAGKEEGGSETTLKFISNGKPALTAAFGLHFIDANYPNLGACKLVAYDAEGLPLGEATDIKTAAGASAFRAIVILDEARKPLPTIASVRIVNGSGWPEVYAAEGVVLDNFMFAPPMIAKP